MPEGPEVETVRRGLVPLLQGQRLGQATVGPHRLRWPADPHRLNQLNGLQVRSLHAHGKLLWLRLGAEGRGVASKGAPKKYLRETQNFLGQKPTQWGVCVRLGMSGTLRVVAKSEKKAPHTHVCIDLLGTKRQLRYIDPRRFGGVQPFFSLEELRNELERLGPDPLRWTQAQQQQVIKQMQRSARCLKDLLLDQSVLAGVGNIYACEALFAARLSPFARGDDLSEKELMGLLQWVQRILHEAVRHQGTTLRLYRTATGQRGAFAQRLRVFQRRGLPCPACDQPIQRITQGGRGTFVCPRCQPMP